MLENLLTDFDPLRRIPLLKIEVLGNSLYAYTLAAASFFIIWFGLGFVRAMLLSRLEKMWVRDDHYDRSPLLVLDSFRTWAFPFIGLYFATRRLDLAPTLDKLIVASTAIAVVVQVIFILSSLATLYMNRSKIAAAADNLAARSSARNLLILLKLGLWVGGFLFLLDNFGIDVTTFIAGLGIGGIAIALAAQALLADTFSSFAIALDKPFEVGDFIVIDGLSGTVEHVGLKTTRVRSIGGELLVFGNSDLTSSRVSNYKKMFERRIVFGVGVTYDTPAEKLERIPELLKDAVTSSQNTRFDRAHFFRFGASSLDFEIVYFVTRPEYLHYMESQQQICLKIVRAFESSGIEFAFPTQTLHVASVPAASNSRSGGDSP